MKTIALRGVVLALAVAVGAPAFAASSAAPSAPAAPRVSDAVAIALPAHTPLEETLVGAQAPAVELAGGYGRGYGYRHRGYRHHGYKHRGYRHHGFKHRGYRHHGFKHRGYRHYGYRHRGYVHHPRVRYGYHAPRRYW